LHPEQAQTSDVDILRGIAGGDEQALSALYDRYRLILFGLILRILHSQAEAEDVLQEVFLQVWRRASDFDGSRERTAQESARDVPDSISDAADDAVKSEQGEIVRAALRELPEEQRRTLLLAYFEGLTQSEIAERLKTPLGTIKTRMRSGMTKLRESLGERMKDLL
jgi:RNA polymerase sigma-70 factor (ECF subfamily)